MINGEAFGCGSNESARYGLELFRRMNLQLPIVTPLHTIHIIEPYIAGLGQIGVGQGPHVVLGDIDTRGVVILASLRGRFPIYGLCAEDCIRSVSRS